MIFGSVLVTGSSRGLGLELVRQLAPVSRLVVATCRHPDNAEALASIAGVRDNVVVKKLDVEQVDSFPAFVEDLKSSVDLVRVMKEQFIESRLWPFKFIFTKLSLLS